MSEKFAEGDYCVYAIYCQSYKKDYKMRKNMKLLLASFVAVTTLSLMSCSSSSGGDGPGPKPGPGPTPNGVTSLQLGQIGAIPTNDAVANVSYPLVLINNTKKAINITSVKSSGVDPRLNITSDSQLFDASGCKEIPAGGTCNIMVKASSLRVNNIGDSGQYGITVDGTSGGATYHETEVVSYENFKKTNQLGTYYNTSGAATTNITRPTQMMVTLPVYFDKAYNNVKLDAPGVNASLVGCGLISANNTYNISANTACSIVLDFRGGRPITSNVQLLANYVTLSKSVKQTKSKALTSGGTPIVGLGFVNLPNAAAYITTGFVTSSIPANNIATQTVTFANNGGSTASLMSLSFAEPNIPYQPTPIGTQQTVGLYTVYVTANTCTSEAGGTGNGSLTSGSSCSVTFRIDGGQNIQYGTLALAMTYETGIGTKTTGYSTYYYPVQSTATLTSSASPSQNEFVNTAVGTQQKTMTVTVTNTGNSAVTLLPLANDHDILKTAGQPGVPNGMTVANNGCTTGTVLAAGGNCTYDVVFDPIESTGGAVINNMYGVIRGTFTNNGIINYPISSSYNIPYSVIEPTDLTFNPSEFQLTTNVNQPVYFPVTIQNTNGNGSGTITNIVFQWGNAGVTGVTIESELPNGCLNSLAFNATCRVVFKYAPTIAESSNGQYTTLAVNYLGGKATQDDIPLIYQAINGNTDIQITNVAKSDLSSPVASSGNGTTGSPYTFYNYGNNFQLTITYTNSGTATANNYTIDGSTLPSAGTGWSIDGSSTCPIGSSTGIDLAGGASCTLILVATNPNLNNVMIQGSPMSFDFPVALYKESGNQLIRNVWSYNNQAGVSVSSNAILSPYYQIGQGVLESSAGYSYYVYPVTLQNNANPLQTAAVNLSINPAIFDNGSATAGLGTSNTTLPSAGVYTVGLAGGESVSPLYLWVPYQITLPFSVLYAQWTYGSLVPAFSSQGVYASNVAAGVMYTANGTTITPRWTSVNSSPTLYPWFGTTSLSTTTAPAAVVDMIQYQGYVYVMTSAGIYSYSITPWVNNGGTMTPESNNTGELTIQSGGASQINGLINDAPGAMSINTVSGTTYALATEAGAFSSTAGAYTIATVANGVFSNTAGAFTGLQASDQITSVAISTAGNIYITTASESAFYCQDVATATSTQSNACTQLALPSAISTAAAASTLSSLTVQAVGGNVVVTQVVTDPNSSTGGQPIPTTNYVYAADSGISTSFTSGATNQTLTGVINANPYTYYYNVDATATTAVQLFGLSGALVSNGGSTPYPHSASAMNYSANLVTPVYYGPTYSSFGTGINSYYSFLPVNGQN